MAINRVSGYCVTILCAKKLHFQWIVSTTVRAGKLITWWFQCAVDRDSCTECSQVSGLVHTTDRSSLNVASLCAAIVCIREHCSHAH